MQKKSTVATQPSFADLHFAVAPYEIEFSVPNDQIYSLYFQKGLQILGQTQYPVQNHEKLKKIELPIQKNVIVFRLFSDKNAEYQWSIYKSVNEMQEFLETKKINLKDILKKQPQKKHQAPKPLEKKQTNPKNENKRSEFRSNTIRMSEQKTDPNSNTTQQNQGEKQGDTSTEGKQFINQGKGLAYNESVVSDVGKFTLKFYLFKASSNQELSKTIQEKSKQKSESKTLQTQNNSSKLPTITESETQKGIEYKKNTNKMVEQESPESEILPNESRKKESQQQIQNEQSADAIKAVDQQPIQITEEPSSERQAEKAHPAKKILFQETPEPFSGPLEVEEQTSEAEALINNETPLQTGRQDAFQGAAEGSEFKRTDSEIIQQQGPDQTIQRAANNLFANQKKQTKGSIYVLLIVLALCLMSYFNVFDFKNYVPEGLKSVFNTTSTLKAGSKKKFSSRKRL